MPSPALPPVSPTGPTFGHDLGAIGRWLAALIVTVGALIPATLAVIRVTRGAIRAVVLWACAPDIARRDHEHAEVMAALRAHDDARAASDRDTAHAVERVAREVGAVATSVGEVAERVEHLINRFVDRAIGAPESGR